MSCGMHVLLWTVPRPKNLETVSGKSVIYVLTRVTMSYEMRASSDWGQSVIQYRGDDTAESCKGTDLRIFRIISAVNMQPCSLIQLLC